MRKLTNSRRYLFAVFVILILSHAAFSQFDEYSVAARWELYSVGDEKVSFLMPRLPVVIGSGDSCRGEAVREYAAYTDGALYLVRITSEVEPSKWCGKKRKFDENNFAERLEVLKTDMKAEPDSANNISKDSVIKLSGTKRSVKLINDFGQKRWFELTVYDADESKEAAKNFLSSLKSENQSTGIEIGDGAERVFGDDAAGSIIEDKITDGKGMIQTIKRLSIKTESPAAQPVTIILKPRANYTEAARQSRIQGRVILRVSFLANGAVGDVSIISGLGMGLTEEAIKAARKIVFLPAQRDGARYSVTKLVEYGFTIY